MCEAADLEWTRTYAQTNYCNPRRPSAQEVNGLEILASATYYYYYCYYYYYYNELEIIASATYFYDDDDDTYAYHTFGSSVQGSKQEVSTVADRCHATSRFRFPFSNFHSLALALAPIGHGNTVVDTFPSPSPGTSRPRSHLATRYMPLRVSDFHFPISIFDLAAFTSSTHTSRHLQARWPADSA